MLGNFGPCSEFTYAWEGGFVNNPHDPGGVTNLGVTEAVYAAYVGRPVSLAEMQNLSRMQTDPLYHNLYWLPVRGDDLPAGVDLMVWDFGVNAGVRGSVSELESVLGTHPDGLLGPNDLAAIRAVNDVPALLNNIFLAHHIHYTTNPNAVYFDAGWERRLNACLAKARLMAGIPPAAPASATNVAEP